MNGKRLKICFAASSGGHLEELLQLRPLMERYDSFLVTEETAFRRISKEDRCYYFKQVNRREWSCIPRMLSNTLRAWRVCRKERPDLVVCTGVLATIPLCLLCKLSGKKLVFIESYAKVKTPTLTGKLLYLFADRFYIQWQELQAFYPKAVYIGGIY